MEILRSWAWFLIATAHVPKKTFTNELNNIDNGTSAGDSREGSVVCTDTWLGNWVEIAAQNRAPELGECYRRSVYRVWSGQRPRYRMHRHWPVILVLSSRRRWSKAPVRSHLPVPAPRRADRPGFAVTRFIPGDDFIQEIQSGRDTPVTRSSDSRGSPIVYEFTKFSCFYRQIYLSYKKVSF